MSKIKKKKEERAAIQKDMTALTTAYEARGENGMSAEELDKFAELRKQRDALDAEIAALEDTEAEDKRYAAQHTRKSEEQRTAEEQRAFETRAFLNYLRGNATAEERAALTIENSGVLVPNDIERDIMLGLSGTFGVLSRIDLRVTKDAHSITFPYATADMELMKVEVGQTTSEGSVSFKGVTLGAIPYKLATIPVSETLLAGADADVRGAIVALFTEHITRGLSKKVLTSGTDSKDIGALLPKAVSVTPAAADSVTFTDLINLRAKVKTPYSSIGRASWTMSSATKNALLGLVDKNGRPLYLESLTANEPDRLLGHPVTIDDNMPEIGAGKAILFGDMKAYKARIADGIRIKVYDESKYSEQGCIGMQAFVTADGRPVVEPGKIEPLAALDFTA